MEGELVMKFIGTVTSAVVAGLALVGILVGIKSIPDVKRYLEMRRM